MRVQTWNIGEGVHAWLRRKSTPHNGDFLIVIIMYVITHKWSKYGSKGTTSWEEYRGKCPGLLAVSECPYRYTPLKKLFPHSHISLPVKRLEQSTAIVHVDVYKDGWKIAVKKWRFIKNYTCTWYGSYDKLTCSVFMRSYKRTAVISDMKIWGYELQVNATCSVGQ